MRMWRKKSDISWPAEKVGLSIYSIQDKRVYNGSLFFIMKYYYEKPENWVGAGETYFCNHPRYNRCTLFREGGRGLAVIQEYYNEKTKARWYGPLKPWLSGDIYFSSGFRDFFEKYASEPDLNGLYPTFTARKVMWILRMKPLRREYWEEEI